MNSINLTKETTIIAARILEIYDLIFKELAFRRTDIAYMNHMVQCDLNIKRKSQKS